MKGVNSMEKYTAIIADVDRRVLREVKNIVDGTEFIKVIDIAFDGNTALSKVIQKKPDILIMNISLSYIEPIGLIEKIRETEGIQDMILIVLMPGRNDFVIKKANDAGADFCFIHPFDENVFKLRLQSILAAKKANASTMQVGGESILLFQITSMMNAIGISTQNKGFQYLRYAIYLAVKNPELLDMVTKCIYPSVARKYDSTPVCVERDIRHVIERAWSKGNMEEINALFGYSIDADRGKPTNSAFIATIADKIKTINEKVD